MYVKFLIFFIGKVVIEAYYERVKTTQEAYLLYHFEVLY